MALIVGGGSVAVDCAMTALRLGASEATMCSLESREELPAQPEELELALEEGVRLMPSWGPSRLMERDGEVSGLELVRCTAAFDAQGRFSPRFDAAQRQLVDGEAVILAVGQEVDREVLRGLAGLEEGQGPVPGKDSEFATGVEKLFACGDALSTTTTVIDAIRSGRDAALVVDRALGGDGAPSEPRRTGRGDARIGPAEGFAAWERVGVERRPAETRRSDWDEIAAGLDREAARAEAARCLQCDLRLDLSDAPRPPERVFELCEEQLERVPSAAGVFRLYDAERAVYAIIGTADLRGALEERLDAEQATFFDFETDEMYTARESELLQQHLAAHGELPPGEDDLDDLF
jgi:hypothetical protein